jgi:O-antigen/teichoic acid export membrane protein
VFQRFFKDSAVYGLTNLLQKISGFGFIALFSYLIKPEAFGTFDFISLISSVVILLVPLEVSQGVARYYALAENPDEKKSYASTSFWFTIGTFFLFGSVVYLLAKPLGAWLFQRADESELVRAGICLIISNGLLYMLQNQLRWELRPKAYSILYLLNSLFCGSITVALIWFFHLQVWGLILGYLGGNFCTIIFGLFLTRQTYALQFSWQRARQMLAFSLPLVPSGLGVFIALSIDRVVIKELLGFYEVGLYGFAIRFSTVISILISGVQLSLTPLVYQHYKESETPGQIAQIFQGFWSLSLVVILGLFLFIEPLMHILVDAKYWDAVTLIPLLAIATLVSNLYIFAPGLGLFKKTGQIAILNLMSALLNLGLNYVLIPLFNIHGAALATLSVALLTSFTYFVLSQRYYPIPFAQKQFIWSTLSVFLFCVFFHWLSSFLGPLGLWALRIAGFTLFSIVLSYWGIGRMFRLKAT